jgi:hypothetical protein
MTGFVFDVVSELFLFGVVPLFLTTATVWILWHVLEKIDDVTEIKSFLTFIVSIVPFAMLFYGGLAIALYDDMMNVSGGLKSVLLPLPSLSWTILVGTIIYIGLAVWLWSHWRKLRIRQSAML